MSSQPKKVEKINIPAVDPSIIQYVILGSIHDKNKVQLISDMKTFYFTIKSKVASFKEERESLNNKKKSLLPANDHSGFPLYPNPKYVWAKHKHQKLFLKYFKCVTDFFDEKIQLSLVLMKFIRDCGKLSIPIILLKDKFMNDIDSKNDEKINSSLKRYTIMTNYISKFEKKGPEKTCRYGYVSITDLWPKLKEVSLKYDNNGIPDKERFYPPNEFDDLFMRFILINKISDSFRVCIERMPRYGTYEDFKKKISLDLSLQSEEPSDHIDSEEEKNEMTPNTVSLADLDKKEEENLNDDADEERPKKGQKLSVIEETQLEALMDQKMDTSNFRNFVLALFRLIKNNNPCTHAMLQLFHCSVIRILFDFYYIENSAILYGRKLKDHYIVVCEEILSQNPNQMNINEKFFDKGEIILPMREIITNDSILQSGSLALYLIQFMVNPLDMAIQVNKAFKIIQESIDSKNCKDHQLNNEISSGMTSDDFINMLKPLYAMYPYVCPSGVCRFIELFCELFQLFDTLSYGLTTFSIVLKDIDSMDKNEEKTFYEEEEEEQKQHADV